MLMQIPKNAPTTRPIYNISSDLSALFGISYKRGNVQKGYYALTCYIGSIDSIELIESIEPII